MAPATLAYLCHIFASIANQACPDWPFTRLFPYETWGRAARVGKPQQQQEQENSEGQLGWQSTGLWSAGQQRQIQLGLNWGSCAFAPLRVAGGFLRHLWLSLLCWSGWGFAFCCQAAAASHCTCLRGCRAAECQEALESQYAQHKLRSLRTACHSS